VVSYRLIDDAAGSGPPSIQEARGGNRESGKSGNDPARGGSRPGGGEPESRQHEHECKTQPDSGDAKGIGAQKHRPQYGIEGRFKA
jgi:hypothetical protein